jgi:hypothetical protein
MPKFATDKKIAPSAYYLQCFSGDKIEVENDSHPVKMDIRKLLSVSPRDWIDTYCIQSKQFN